MDLRASRRFFNEPRKNSPSVSTESAQAPAASRAWPAPPVSNGSRITPREGEAGFRLRENVQAVSAQRRGKIAQRRGRLHPYLSAVSGRTRLR